jgi:hypothetical protein
MFRRMTVAILVSLFVAPVVVADENGVDLALARQYFQDAKAISEADGGELWGKRLYGPMLFGDPGSGTLVANQADPQGHLKEQDGVFAGSIPEDLGLANTAQNWAGVQWTMIIWPLPQWKYSRQRLMAHEMFHRIQDDIGLAAADVPNPHLDERDGRIWLRMEWRALYEALIRVGEQQRQAIQDALVFREFRRSLFPDAAEHERQLEMNEGLAEYTGLRLSGLPESVLPDRAALRIERDESGDSFQRSFAYASGPAYGLLLDEFAPDWRKGLKASDDLGELLANACGLQLPHNLQSAADQAVTRYGGQQVIAEEARRHEQREKRLAAYRARFIGGPVLLLPATGEIRYGFNPHGIETLPGEGQVFQTLSVRDDWGVLEVTSGGALMRRGPNGSVAGFIVPAPSDADARPVEGDGWTLRLNEGWTLVAGERDGDYTIGRSD